MGTLTPQAVTVFTLGGTISAPAGDLDVPHLTGAQVLAGAARIHRASSSSAPATVSMDWSSRAWAAVMSRRGWPNRWPLSSRGCRS